MASGKSIAALLAGFGTGYLSQQKIEADRKSQEARDKRENERFELEKQRVEMENKRQIKLDAQEAAVDEGLAAASSERVGHGLRTKTGEKVGVTEQDIAGRLEGGNLSPETQAAVAKTYAQGVTQNDVEGWTDGMSGKDALRTTTKADIVRDQGTALMKGGRADRMQGMQMADKATELDLKSLRQRILSAQSIEDLSKEYDDVFPDGLTLKGEMGQDGKFYKFTEDSAGKRSNYQTFPSFDEFKKNLDTMVNDNPDSIIKYWNESRELERQNKKDTRDEKVSDAQLKKYDQDIAEGKLRLESLPQSIQLDLQAKRANITQSNESSATSRANREKTKEETKVLKTGSGNDKLPNSVREAMWYKNATPEQRETYDQLNDKSAKVTPDGVGGFIINGKNGLSQMNEDGVVKLIKMPDPNKPAVPANRPPLSSFGK